jgi:hypothetical protein
MRERERKRERERERDRELKGDAVHRRKIRRVKYTDMSTEPLEPI